MRKKKIVLLLYATKLLNALKSSTASSVALKQRGFTDAKIAVILNVSIHCFQLRKAEFIGFSRNRCKKRRKLQSGFLKTKPVLRRF